LARHQEAPLPKLPIRNTKEKTFWQNLANRLAAKNKEERPQSGTEVLELLLEDPILRKTLASRDESAAGWCRTLLPRPWSLPSVRLEGELSAETPAAVLRAEEELKDGDDLVKKFTVHTVRLAIEQNNSSWAYPRLSERELADWLASGFGASQETAKLLWRKTSGEVSLIEFELCFWQKKKLLRWNGAGWEWKESLLKDVSLSPASQKEFLTLTATLPDEEHQLLTRLSSFLEFFRPEEIVQTDLWEEVALEPRLKNLQQAGFLLPLGENRLAFSRPGLREALYCAQKSPKETHRKIWNFFVQCNQISDKSRSSEWEYQAASAQLWEEAAQQALAAAAEAGTKEDFKTESWYLDRSLAWAQKLPAGARRESLFLEIYRARGDFFGRQGELEKAISEYTCQLKMARKLNNAEEEADAYIRLGNHLRQKPDYPKAEKNLKRALALFETLGQELKLSYAHNNLGATYAHQQRVEEALLHYTQAAEIQRRLGDTKKLASTLNNIGVAHMMADRLQEAVRFLREALQLNRKLDEKEQVALCLNNLGFILAQRGESNGAKTLLMEALELNRQISSQKWEVLNIDNLAIVAYRSGNYPEAIRYALLGLELSEKINFKGSHLSLLASLGGSLKAQGQYTEAEKYLVHGLNLAKEIHDLPSEIQLHLEMTELVLLMNDFTKAEKIADLAAKKIKGISDRSLRGRLLMLLAKLAARKGKTSEMEKHLSEAEKLLAESEYFPERHRLALERIELMGMQDRSTKIEELLSGVRTLSAVPASPTLSCEGLFLEARSAFHLGQFDTARRKGAAALKLAYELSEPEKIWRMHHFMAKISMEEKNYRKAFGELQSAAQVLENLKENFTTDESMNSYLNDPQKVELLSEIQKIAETLGQ
jgi:tetratricopeptide (TPR) repeat protein